MLKQKKFLFNDRVMSFLIKKIEIEECLKRVKVGHDSNNSNDWSEVKSYISKTEEDLFKILKEEGFLNDNIRKIRIRVEKPGFYEDGRYYIYIDEIGMNNRYNTFILTQNMIDEWKSK